KIGRDILRFELESKDYVPGGQKADEVYGRMLRKPAGQRLKLLRESEGAEGQFLWAILRDSFHYAAVHLASIADTARDVDCASRCSRLQWAARRWVSSRQRRRCIRMRPSTRRPGVRTRMATPEN